eukprot:Skav232359  [mRNA]  locus=scaffold2646:533467:535827:+ [translate_table: standard]
MGFLNSVSPAQHVHRNLVKWSGAETCANVPSQELRKDKSFTVSNPAWRVYLDNYDLLEKVDCCLTERLKGTEAPGVSALLEQYGAWEVPRNVKKSVRRSTFCEVQGASVNGELGVAYPRESKIVKYFSLALSLAKAPAARLKQWQVVCGGLVYFSMFRRPLVACLNGVWGHIESYQGDVSVWKASPLECRLEVLRFLGLCPLARLDFRLAVHPMVTCSDASSTGGGACCSVAVTQVGSMISNGTLRGETGHPEPDASVLSIGLFDGIGALRVALDLQDCFVLHHIAVEPRKPAQRVVEAHYPGTEQVESVELVDSQLVKSWSLKYSQCSAVVLGSGPPCQGVSGLNADRQGALKDARSSLFTHVSRIRSLVKQHFTWCPVYSLMESVASMDRKDREHMSDSFGCEPIRCDSGTMTWCHRPRLYWVDWELREQPGAVKLCKSGDEPSEWVLEADQPLQNVLKPGWLKVDPGQAFPTFTTSRPRSHPGRKPAGLSQCSPTEVQRWQQDEHRFPPYQYMDKHCLVNKSNVVRVPDVEEREMMLGFPLHYTAPCLGKSERRSVAYGDQRLSLLGNSWSVPVVAWLLNQLLAPLGLCPSLTPQALVDRCQPGVSATVQGRLQRLPLQPTKVHSGDAHRLATRLCGLLSIKGEDIMINSASSQQVKFHRLRASVPARLWRWKVISGWAWRGSTEHINALELRAVLTTMRWRVEHQKQTYRKFIHLTDSLVCLHSLSRGRSSSRKLRRTMSRINALILVSGCQPLWGYVHTDSNPADKPSRWAKRVRSKFKNA